MDDFLSDKVMHLWKKEYSSQLKKYTKYETTDQFHHIANMCAPGKSYYYILNLSNFGFDFIHPNVETIVGIRHELANMDTLLSVAPPEELEMIEKKEKIVYEFIQSFKNPQDILSYKIVYTYRCKGLKNKIQTMMFQSTILTLTETGKIEHAFVIHSDISYLGNVTTDWVSFISLDDKPSYLNIKAESTRFDPKFSSQKKTNFTSELTKRELEIVKLMSQGLSASAISEKLFISFHTARTHRKNILFKTNSKNTAELIAKCLAEGVV